ncbi:AraC family transcriptional regulator [Spirosoma endbachense]|uniref:Helix-turn-helix domain-containing protein n=1 Tax=Spirosoma endbachense TaxID=2666025 RepID=A0A6P1W6A1_9BACT|nr:AraC family transcriptional regulator [Spirosoma endbachense]QHW00854.1 helix-turn-helix domain-containing protein [Spirosoma endbachense]
MKQPLRKDLEPVATSFIVKELIEPHFDPNWHFHPHYQLFLVEEGTGTRFIGDSIKPFGPGDLVFLGPNLPHLWRSDQAYFNKQSGLTTRGIVVYFSEDFLGNDFFGKQEMMLLRQLLNHARQGLEWNGPTRARAEAALKNMTKQPMGFDRVISLLTLLNDLSHASDYRYLTSPGYTNTVKPTETDRMQLVHDYVLGHFPDDLSLETIADLAGMTPPAFCRYFKARANKTFSEFVSEVRIGHACKLLINGKLSVTQISFESGFRTLSNFNRQFKDITGQTPSGYVKTYRQL